jgi:hypothetical protein
VKNPASITDKLELLRRITVEKVEPAPYSTVSLHPQALYPYSITYSEVPRTVYLVPRVYAKDEMHAFMLAQRELDRTINNLERRRDTKKRQLGVRKTKRG